MGSDWRPSLYPLPHSAVAVTTLPSVAELLSSSAAADSPSSYYRPDDSVPPPQGDRPSSRSTPPAAPRLNLSSAVFPPSQPSSSTAVHHASPHVSPTDCRDLAPVSEHSRYQHPPSQFIAPSSSSASTCEASQSLQDATRSQVPANSQRQDSAISQQRFGPSQELQSCAPSTNFSFSSSGQGPDGTLVATSPRPNSHPTSPSSPQTPIPNSHILETSSRSTSQSSRRGHTKSSSLGNQPDMEPTKSREHVPAPSKPATGDASAREQPANNTSRQRFNVRFIANYTSENMPTSQKPRQESSPTISSSTEIPRAESAPAEQVASPPTEPSTQPVVPKSQPTEDQSHVQQRRRESSVERCQGCNEAWKRPLPDTDSYRQDSQASNQNDLSRLSMNLIAHLQAHQRKADAMYDRWKWKHSHCVPQDHDEYDLVPNSPPFAEPQDGLQNTTEDAASRPPQIPETPSNKRKSDLAHEENSQINSKFRKVAFEGSPAAAPPVRPPAPV
ncbi:hypothetical protein IQ07DRAFT_601063 [Pyrenochaeta sp. DS3sAY3a]|nr:hypothetical protein IQ07DRAFT_601063 [Pyrenochaeta sp. DS3sAY3a]